jgi:single-strand DNA-binding protein
MLNVTTLMGRLVADPELRYTPNNVAVTNFTIAVDRSYVKSGAERQADFIDIVCWRNTAEFACKYFRKGQMIALQGSIQTRSYNDKEGIKRKAFEILADTVFFADSKKQDAAASVPAPMSEPTCQQPQQAPYNATVPAYMSGTQSDFSEIVTDDDLPF